MNHNSKLNIWNTVKRLMLGTLLIVGSINLTSCGGGDSGDTNIAPDSDTTPPTITLTGNSSLSLLVGSSYEDEGAAATDNVDSSVTVETSSNLDTTRIGTYQIIYTATDSAGNQTQIIREIEVEATQINTAAFEGSWRSDCIVETGNNFRVSMELEESANTGSMTITGYNDECITQDYTATLDISLSYPSSHTSSICSNAVKVNGIVNYPINVLVNGQTDPLSIPNERFLNSLGFFEEDFLVAFDLMCTNEAGTILYSGLVTSENDGSSDSRRPVTINTDGFWRKQ